MTTRETPVRRRIYVMSCIPVIDSVLNQINTATHATVGGLSLLQVVRMPLLALLAAACLVRLWSRLANARRVPYYAPLALILIAIASTKELLDTEALTAPSLIAYGQILYWTALSTYVRLEVETIEEARTILLGVAAGALSSAGSIVLGYLIGGPNPYADDGVSASAGWFNTAKTITGVLLTGAIVLLYLGSNRKGRRYPIAAVLCCGCCVLTYARAGHAALALMILWLVAWSLLCRQRHGRRTVIQFLAILAIIGVLGVPALLKSQSFINRWEDIQDDENGGSGRAAFWRVAAQNYQRAKPAELLFGIGFNGMSEMLYRDYGTDIRHTHNDCLDMLLIGGLYGILWWASLIASFLGPALRRLRSPEGFAAAGLLIVFGCHGQLTGQLFGTDAMAAYTVTLASLWVIQTNCRKQDLLPTSAWVPWPEQPCAQSTSAEQVGPPCRAGYRTATGCFGEKTAEGLSWETH